MGFFDFLKGIIPEKFFNINIYKITLNADSIIIGKQRINDPAIVEKVINKLEEYKDKDKFPTQIIHKDLDESYTQYEEISINQKESLKILKLVLSEEDVESILMARRVKFAYDKNDVKLAKKLENQLIKQYPEKGKKVYNLISGGYFDEMIIPFIDVFKSEHGQDYIQEFRKFYYDLFKFFPLAIFVGNSTTENQLISGINDRLKLNVPFIRLHAMGGSNIKKVDETRSKLKLDEKFSINDKKFVCSSGLQAQILEIKLKKN